MIPPDNEEIRLDFPEQPFAFWDEPAWYVRNYGLSAGTHANFVVQIVVSSTSRTFGQ